ncbi:hypothetical protein MCAL160_0004 [Mycoplasmopsis californica HAZ160_1]|uniref:PQ loop repeat family protein n=1 Tax=Mycoplasmopsis californica HAZ160_1 TaxID=1397850 RepID=A0AAT9F7B5_9BACT|nr:PQ-loop domain-containing transporter [Mycoplasmopsis californica]BAP00772.1 hypothetical protein MCAL160_0004 [Mycoplasmopsis californica HAZ160_1]BBG40626.1 hypothetical protein MCAL106_0004 [Mycoplasmopsis californica]BBG41221.1 hypothetical protein MCAL106E_0004 [Mycoplasmopsis californica]BBG41814.1 hypothetical protein MCAL106L_0004 [Mycoplasmopsis californica]BBG42408.1 hypothetical protein MCAL160E_0004 [Mycoplasmopsis californica]
MNDFLKNFFTLNPQNKVSAYFAFIFGLSSIILTISVGIPQLVSLLKTKKTSKGVNFYTFWIFFTGVVGWAFIGSWDPNPAKMVAAAYANMVSAFIFSFTIFFSYKYSETTKIRKKAWLSLVISLFISGVITALAIWGIVEKKQMNKHLFDVCIVLFPMLTTLSFFPVALKSLEQKRFTGMSKGMLYTLLFINVAWLLYWISLAFNRNGLDSGIITSITWQTAALLIYLSQVILLIKNEHDDKKRTKIKI